MGLCTGDWYGANRYCTNHTTVQQVDTNCSSTDGSFGDTREALTAPSSHHKQIILIFISIKYWSTNEVNTDLFVQGEYHIFLFDFGSGLDI